MGDVRLFSESDQAPCPEPHQAGPLFGTRRFRATSSNGNRVGSTPQRLVETIVDDEKREGPEEAALRVRFDGGPDSRQSLGLESRDRTTSGSCPRRSGPCLKSGLENLPLTTEHPWVMVQLRHEEELSCQSRERTDRRNSGLGLPGHASVRRTPHSHPL